MIKPERRLSGMSRVGASALTLAMVLWGAGCQSSSGGGDGGSGGGGGDGGDGGGGGEEMRDVPYEGGLPDLPADAVVDELDYFPLVPGSVWRYRKQTAMWQDPPPVTQGGESTVEAGEGENEFIRKTVTIIDLLVDDEPAKVRQEIAETYVVTPAVGMVGPNVKFKDITIVEREVGTNRFVRKLYRSYFPAYVLISDAWQLGNFDTNLQGSEYRIMEEITLRGDEEPRMTQGLFRYRVETSAAPQVLPMEGQYREGIRQIDVYDDLSEALGRTYWVQPGVGIVQWRFRDTNNLTFTLTEANLESADPPAEGGEGEGESEEE